MIEDITKLQRWLMEKQGKLDKLNVRTYAHSSRCQRDVANLTKLGLPPEDISYTLDLPMLQIRKYQAMAAKAKAEEREFFSTGFVPWERRSEGGYVAILQK